jgi:branched-chain amino acid transport system permease protein
MISSVGLAIFLQELMRLQSGSIAIWIPPLLSDQYLARIGGSFPIRIGLLTSLSIAFSGLAVAAVCLWLSWSRFGLAWRACAQHPLLAAMCGIDAQHVAAVSFAIAGGLSGITGWTSAIVYGGANFSVGLMAGFKAMFASVIGGFGTIRGAIVGAIALAVAEVSWSAAFSTVYRDVAVFGFIVLVLVFRPEGLLGLASRGKSFETQEP